MQFANYTDYRVAVLKFIDGDDANSGALDQDTLDLLIALGESRVYQGDTGVAGLRVSDMEQPLSLAITSNAATLPADCLALKRVQFAGEKPLDYMSEDQLERYLTVGGGGPSRHYTQKGRTLIFYPTATGTVGGRYYAKPADISAGLHATFNRYPEVYLFGALAEAAPFIGEDSRIPMWKAMWSGWMESAARNERLLAPDGSRLTQKSR
jgi:hypothetical protein